MFMLLTSSLSDLRNKSNRSLNCKVWANIQRNVFLHGGPKALNFFRGKKKRERTDFIRFYWLINFVHLTFSKDFTKSKLLGLQVCRRQCSVVGFGAGTLWWNDRVPKSPVLLWSVSCSETVFTKFGQGHCQWKVRSGITHSLVLRIISLQILPAASLNWPWSLTFCNEW